MEKLSQKKFSRAEALKAVKRIAGNGAIVPTGHLKERMIKWDFNMQDVISAIKNGVILKEPEPHPKTGHWIYSIEGKTVDGQRLEINIEIIEDKNIVRVLTGYPGKR